MASKKSKKKVQPKPNTSQDARRTRTLQIVFIIFSVILVLSMILSIASK
jgi:hypothetical protein